MVSVKRVAGLGILEGEEMKLKSPAASVAVPPGKMTHHVTQLQGLCLMGWSLYHQSPAPVSSPTGELIYNFLENIFPFQEPH